MTNKNYLREFIRYTILNVLGMIGLSCYILADTFFISKGLGTKGLAALNLAIPIYSFVNGIGLLLGMGGATKYTIYRGQQSGKEANRVFSNTLYFALVAITFLMVAGLLFSNSITVLLRANNEIFEMTRIYLKMILLFSPFFILNQILICFVRNDGNPQLSMFAMLFGSFSNIILDYIFIFPMKMGIFGAVLATSMAPMISMAILSYHFVRKQNHFHYHLERPSWNMIRHIAVLGTPSLITELAAGIVMIVFNMLILRLNGNTGVAAYGVIANLAIVVTSMFTGIAQGMQPIISKSYGENDQHGMFIVLRYALITVVTLSGLIYLGLYMFHSPVIDVFNSEQNAQLHRIASAGLKLYFLGIPFAGANIIISMYFASRERALPAWIITLLRGIILIIPVAILMATMFGMTGVWMTYPITEAIISIFSIIFLLFLRKA